MIRGRTCLTALAVLLACPATAGAVPDLRITEHSAPATAATGQVVEARVTVTNVGDTATASETEIDWAATNGEGFELSEFELRGAVCPPGAEDLGGTGNMCVVGAPIEPGASVTAVFSGSSRYAMAVELRARVYDRTTGLSSVDTRPLTISGPTIPLPLAARISNLRLDTPRLRPGQKARLRYRLDRRPKNAYAMLLRCKSSRGCRRTQFVLNSVVKAPRKRGRNTLRYRLPATLEPGRYRIRLWTSAPEHREHSRSVTFRVTA